MPVGHKTQGVHALLFDRLGHPPPPSREEAARYANDHRNYHMYDSDGLRRSIRQQLTWLLNTRVPVAYDILDARNRDRVRSTLDYGLPDLSAYPLGDPTAMERLRVHLAQTIALFEPRLQNPAVSILAVDGRAERLQVEVRGQIQFDEVMTPATFVVGAGSGGDGTDGP